MFDTYFSFEYKGKHPPGPKEDFEHVHIYKFKTDNEVYIFRGEVFIHQTIAVKYYPKSYEDSPSKYTLLTGKNKGGGTARIISTCLQIMLDLRKKESNPSYIFQASGLVGEMNSETKRYRIYKELLKIHSHLYLLSITLSNHTVYT